MSPDFDRKGRFFQYPEIYLITKLGLHDDPAVCMSTMHISLDLNLFQSIYYLKFN